MDMPNVEAIIAFHKRNAPSEKAFQIIYTHCQIVCDIASELMYTNSLSVDKELVKAASLLHDVGYYPLLDTDGYVPKDSTITHGVVGAKLLREAGMPETIVRIAERHTGIGLAKEYILAAKLPLPARDLVAETPEEWLILYADKFHTKFVQRRDVHDGLGIGTFVSADGYLRHAARFGADNAARFTALIDQYGVPDLEQLSKKYDQPIQ